MEKFLRFVLCISVGLLAPLARAVPPQTINYQGYLTNPGGTPVNTTVSMTFRLYAAASGGAAIYNETQPSVSVSNGSFNAVIGAVTPLNLPFDIPYWLTVAINADGEMSPRQPLASSPYAFRASYLAPTATIPAGNLIGTIVSPQIALNAVTQQKLSPLSGAAPGKVLGTDGSNLQWQTAGNGTVTSVGLGPGMNGGPITTSGTISLSATQLLPPFGCITNQIPYWNGSAWACSSGTAVPAGGAVGQVLIGTGAAPAWSDSPSLRNIVLPDSTISVGNIIKAGDLFIHNFGSRNTFVGKEGGNLQMTGTDNTGIGNLALHFITTGDTNVAVGSQALLSITTGNGNVAIGTESLNTIADGSSNTAVGGGALLNAINNENTAVGYVALVNTTTGSRNIGIGYQAGNSITTGSNNIMIGHLGIAADTATIRIGSGQTRTFIAGIRGVTTAGAAIPVLIDAGGQLGTISSSRRFKDDIADMNAASSALMKLRPVTFHYKSDQNMADRAVQYGLIAEEVAEVYPGLTAKSADGQIETVMYHLLPPMLLNEFQKQQRTIASQATELAQQHARMEMLERELSVIKSMLARR